MKAVLFVFLDGVGIGPRDPDRNPFFAARLPVLHRVLGGGLPHTDSPLVQGPEGVAFPLDACLDTEGTPQSGTGQISLLTGRNAARIFGRHFGPWPPVRIRPLLAEENLLVTAGRRGIRVRFANAYPEGYVERTRSRFLAAPPLAAHAAGALVHHGDALARGDAVASEIVNTRWRQEGARGDVPEVSPEEAGRNLARLARTAQLTLYAHYATDWAGHRGGHGGAVQALERVDRFLGGVVEDLAPGTTLLVTSDHGNVEEVGRGHTRNPALGMAVGPEAAVLARDLASLLHVAPTLLRLLDPG